MEFESELPSAFWPNEVWFTVAIPRGKPITGYVAGPPIGIQGHWVAKRSRPCADWMTRGEEPCPYCASMVRRPIVYLPFYSGIAFERLVVILSKTTFQTIRLAQFGDHFTAIQSDVPKTAAIVRPCPGGGTLKDVRDDLVKQGPQDIRPYLLHLWGMSLRKKTVASKAKEALRKLPAAEFEQAPATVAEAMRQWRQRLQMPDRPATGEEQQRPAV